MTDYERDCPETEADDWDSHTYNTWKGGRIDYSEACEWESEDEDEDKELENEDDEEEE